MTVAAKSCVMVAGHGGVDSGSGERCSGDENDDCATLHSCTGRTQGAAGGEPHNGKVIETM
ncbi:S-layer domain protein [Sesbania bispinosa]|nr:S-layer domain protein [Sesbania bispinosa]